MSISYIYDNDVSYSAEKTNMPTEDAASYFSVDTTTGDIKIDPMLNSYSEGIFIFDIIASQQHTLLESTQIAHIIKQVILLF